MIVRVVVSCENCFGIHVFILSPRFIFWKSLLKTLFVTSQKCPKRVRRKMKYDCDFFLSPLFSHGLGILFEGGRDKGNSLGERVLNLLLDLG
jgi:hypothetical protein